jgi:hypothetical protein
MTNTKYQSTAFLKQEEKRLLELIDKLAGIRFMKANRARAQKTLQCVQAELTSRGA